MKGITWAVYSYKKDLDVSSWLANDKGGRLRM